MGQAGNPVLHIGTLCGQGRAGQGRLPSASYWSDEGFIEVQVATVCLASQARHNSEVPSWSTHQSNVRVCMAGLKAL